MRCGRKNRRQDARSCGWSGGGKGLDVAGSPSSCNRRPHCRFCRDSRTYSPNPLPSLGKAAKVSSAIAVFAATWSLAPPHPLRIALRTLRAARATASLARPPPTRGGGVRPYCRFCRDLHTYPPTPLCGSHAPHRSSSPARACSSLRGEGEPDRIAVFAAMSFVALSPHHCEPPLPRRARAVSTVTGVSVAGAKMGGKPTEGDVRDVRSRANAISGPYRRVGERRSPFSHRAGALARVRCGAIREGERAARKGWGGSHSRE